ncbi:cobalamin biosynthesis protein [Pseudonocardia sp. C8]|uniref:cobalamin biosynthesis protein n=1 Tax=Pseudonocardia sp. C8 TaxID=2762759 RepID=UPI00351C85B9
MRGRARAAGLTVGILADAVLGDPRRGHPVAGFGMLAAGLERRVYRDSRAAGAGYTVVLVGGAVLAGAGAEHALAGAARSRWAWRGGAGGAAGGAGRIRAAGRGTGRTRAAGGGSGRAGAVTGGGRARVAAQVLLTAVTTWAVLGGTSLTREGAALAGALDAGDLAAARARIPSLCARDPELLDAAGLARAGVESLAENTSDAVVGPLVWGAVAGLPGLLGYRAVNTLDAMVGYRSVRHLRFGWASARLDDLVNLVPSRVAALVTVAVAPLAGGSPRAALRAWRRDAAGHPSPNAGPVEAAAAGALGLRLGGTTTYAHGVEERPVLGDGHPPGPADLHRAVRLSRLVAGVSAALAVGTAWALAARRADTGLRRAVTRAPGKAATCSGATGR